MSTHLTPPVGPDDHVLGPDDAPITLVEYGDYECPYCARAQPIIEDIRRQLGDRLRFVFRNFPLTQAHPYAEHAAEMAEAAGAQGKFWPMHDLLYEHQDALDDADLLRYAARLGMDTDAAAEALASGEFAERVREDFMSGVRSGVNGTPTFFINGVRHEGSWDEESLLGALAHAGASRR